MTGATTRCTITASGTCRADIALNIGHGETMDSKQDILTALRNDADVILANIHACSGVYPLADEDADVWARLLEESEPVPDDAVPGDLANQSWQDIAFGHFEETIASLERGPDRSAALRCVRVGRHAVDAMMRAQPHEAACAFAGIAYGEVYKALWQAQDAVRAEQ